MSKAVRGDPAIDVRAEDETKQLMTKYKMHRAFVTKNIKGLSRKTLEKIDKAHKYMMKDISKTRQKIYYYIGIRKSQSSIERRKMRKQ